MVINQLVMIYNYYNSMYYDDVYEDLKMIMRNYNKLFYHGVIGYQLQVPFLL